MLFIFAFSFLIFKIAFPQCFDQKPLTTICNQCSYDFYKSSLFEWKSSEIDINNCISQIKDSLIQEIFISSDQIDCSTIVCNGTSVDNPFPSLFSAFKSGMINHKSHFGSTIVFYLFGSNSHSIYYDDDEAKVFMLFRRFYVDLTIQPLLCKFKNTKGCFEDDSKIIEILVKSSNILFFISNKLTLKQIKFNGIDIFLYNTLNDNVFKKNNKNNQICYEEDIKIKNSDSLKSSCFINNNLNVSFSSYTYGFINLEFLYDCILCSKPKIFIEDTQFINFNIINSASNTMISIINILNGFDLEINIINTVFMKFFLMKGILNINKIIDDYYKYVSLSNFLGKKNSSLNILFKNVSISQFNFYDNKINTLNKGDYISIINFDNTFVFSNIPSIVFNFLESKINDINNINIRNNYYFFIVSGYNNISVFSFEKTEISSVYYGFLIYFPEIYFEINLKFLKLLNNLEIQLFFKGNSTVNFENNLIDNLKVRTYFFGYYEMKLNIKNCLFINLFNSITESTTLISNLATKVAPSSILSKYYNNSIQTVFGEINLIDSEFNVFTGVSILQAFNNVFWKVYISNSTFYKIQIGNEILFVLDIQNLFKIKKSNFLNIYSLYLFSFTHSNSRIFSEINFENSSSGFYISVPIVDPFDICIIIFQKLNFKNINSKEIDFMSFSNNKENNYQIDSFEINDSNFENIYFFDRSLNKNIIFSKTIYLANIRNLTVNCKYKFEFTALIKSSVNNYIKIKDSKFSQCNFNFVNIFIFAIYNSIFSDTVGNALRIEYYDERYLVIINSQFINNSLAISYSGFSEKFFFFKDILFSKNIQDIYFSHSYSDINFDSKDPKSYYKNLFTYCNLSKNFMLTPVDQTYDYQINECKKAIENRTFTDIILNKNIFMDIIEWNLYFLDNFGINNCSFVETQAQILFKAIVYKTTVSFLNCRFFSNFNSKLDLIFGGKYIIYIFNSSFENITNYFGKSVFFLVDSIFYMKNNTFNNIILSDKGIIFIKGVNLYLFNCKFYNISSNSGSVSYGAESEIKIGNVIMNISSANKKGGFIYLERGEIMIDSSVFINGFSDQGGIFYLRQMTIISFTDSFFINNTILSEGNIYIKEADPINFFVFFNLTFLNNKGKTASLFYLNAAAATFDSIVFFNNSAEEYLCIFYNDLDNFNVSLVNFHLEDNNCGIGLLYIEKFDFSLQKSLFKNNIFLKESNVLILFSNLFINNNTFNQLLSNNFILKNKFYFKGVESFIEFLNNNCSFQFSTGGISASNSILNLSYNIFENCVMVIVLNQFSSLIISNSYLRNNKGEKGSAISVKISKCIVYNVTFFNNEDPSLMGSDIYIENTYNSINFIIQINHSNFQESKGKIIFLNGKININLINNLFFQNVNNNGAQAIYSLNSDEIYIENSRFINYYFMSAIEILKSDLFNSQINIIKCEFINSSTKHSGGAISLAGNMNLTIINSNFKNNSATIDGGAISFSCSTCDKYNKIVIKNNLFLKNNAIISGGAIKSYFLETEIFKNNEFKDNFDFTGNSVSTSPSKFFISTTYEKDHIIDLKKINFNLEGVSGQTIELFVLIFDKFDNFMQYENEGEVTIEHDDNSYFIQDLKILYNTEFVKNGIAKFNLYVHGQNNFTYYLIVSYKKKNIEFSLRVEIYLRSCKNGEYLINSQCLPCSYGFYSLSPENPCQICPKDAICPGLNYLFPNEGFWRFHENSTLIIKCSNILKCPDISKNYLINNSSTSLITYNFSKSFEYICGNGSFGHICSNCIRGYGLSSENNCIECEMDVGIFFLIIINFLILIYESTVVFNVDENDSIKRSLTKVLINHNNYLILLETFTYFIYSDQITSLQLFNTKFNSVGAITDGTILDCIINKYFKNEELVMVRIAFFSFVPIIVIFSVFLARLLMFVIPVIKKKQKEKNILNIFISSFILVIYSFYPKLVYNSASLLKCINLDDSKDTYLQIDPNIKCWDETHNFYLYTIFIPNLLIWCIGWPLLLFIALVIRFKVHKKKFLNRSTTNFIKSKTKTMAINQFSENDVMNTNQEFRNSTVKPLDYTIEGLSPEKALINDGYKDSNTISSNRKLILSENDTNKMINSSQLKNSSLRRSQDKDIKFILHDDQKEDIFSSNKIYKFLTIDYHSDSYYWDVFFLMTNLFVIFVSIFSNSMELLIYTQILITTFFFIMCITLIKKPFRYEEVNSVLLCSYFSIIITFYCFLNIIVLGAEYVNQIQLYVSLVFISNLIFYLFWGYVFGFVSVVNSIKKFIAKRKEKKLAAKLKSDKEGNKEIETNKDNKGELFEISKIDVMISQIEKNEIDEDEQKIGEKIILKEEIDLKTNIDLENKRLKMIKIIKLKGDEE